MKNVYDGVIELDTNGKAPPLTFLGRTIEDNSDLISFLALLTPCLPFLFSAG